MAIKSPITVAEIKDEDLYGVALRAVGEAADLSDVAIERKLRAAEDFYERDLGIRLTQTRVFSGVFERQQAIFPADQLGLPGDYDEDVDIAEPAYDYDPQNWVEKRWFATDLNYRPVRSIERMVFAYPSTRKVMTIPVHWISLDQKFGRLRLKPGEGEAILMVFNSFFLSIASGARGIPMSVFIDYTTGFTPSQLTAQHADLLEGIRLRSVLQLMGILGTARTGGVNSGSLSMDGLSESQSFGGKWGAYGGAIELARERETEIRESWRRHEQGVPVVWV